MAFFRWIRRLANDSRGNVAMLFGLSLPVMVLISLGGLDLHRASTVRMNLQDALDAAALAAARSPYTDDVNIQRVGMAALRSNLAAYPDITLLEGETSFTLRNEEVVVATARVAVQTIVANIFLPPYGQFMDDTIPVGSRSEVTRGTSDIEVSLVLDITGSMEGSRLTDLQTAAKDLVDLVVQDDQSINSTRMALAPYSMGVNAGTYLNAVRGAARGPTSITGASWMVANTQKTISAVSIANPGVFTANGHGYSDGDFVWISGVTDQGGSGSDLAGHLNGRVYRIKKVDNNSFRLELQSGSTWSAISTSGRQKYTANSGIARRCQVPSCEVVVTSANHGLSTGEDVRIRNVNGMTQINTDAGISGSNLYKTITWRSASTFSLNGVIGPNVSNYTNSGTVQCLEYGCASYLFTNNNGDLRVYDASDCVSERVGPQAYTDAAPSTAPVAFSYVGTTNVGQGGCMTTTFTPLTSNKTTLKQRINGYVAEGGTAGQIGVGWGWYLVSPNWGSLFPVASQPMPYGQEGLLKVVIIMTDGEFNAVYKNGVRAKDSGTGGGSNERWINQNSDNGNPFQQSVNMCAAMKAQGIIVYTVGFDIGSGDGGTPNVVDTAAEVMARCATSASHVYMPNNGSSLRTAFASIGRSISQLRISR